MGCCGDNEEGKPHLFESNFKGPINNRSCTDVLCCILFLIAVLGLATVAVWAFVMGDYKRIVYPTDSHGQICGVDQNVKLRPYLYFFDIAKCLLKPAQSISIGCATPQVCVSKCPDYYWSVFDNDRSRMICQDGKPGNAPEYNSTNILDLASSLKCAAYIVQTESVLNRCMPSAIKDAVTKLVDAQGNRVDNETLSDGTKAFLKLAQIGQNIVNDIIKSWYYIVTGLVLTMVLSLLWTLLLRFIAKIIVYTTLVLFVLIFGALTAAGFIRWNALRQIPTEGEFKFTLNVNYYLGRQETWLGIGIACGIILVVILLILIFLRERIRIAIALIGEASKAISFMMSTLVFPLVTFILQCCVVVLAVGLAIYLQTVGPKEGVSVTANYSEFQNVSSIDQARDSIQNIFNAIPCDPTNATTIEGKVCHFVKYGGKTYIYVLQAFNLFMFFWLYNFVIGVGLMTLAGSFASYYFAFSKPHDIPSLPLLSSFWRAVRYHLGTIAFGSLILAIVQFVRAILEYINQRCKGSENPFAQFVLKCFMCCLWCLEKCLKFLNKNAFIITAIYSKNFCMAAKDAFSLIMRNIVRVFVVDKLTDFVLFIGKLVVVAAVTTLSYFFYDGTLAKEHNIIRDQTPIVNYVYVPIIITIIGSFIIVSLFFSVYSMAVDTLFLCFLEDLERNDGSPEKPYFMSKDLMGILGKRNTKPPS